MPPQPESQQQQQAPDGGAATTAAIVAPFATAELAPIAGAIATRALTGVALRQAAKGIGKVLAQIAERRYSDGADFALSELREAFPDRKPSELAKLIAQERKFEVEFRRKMKERLNRDIPAALQLDEADERMAALQKIFDREKRYSLMREEAMLLRALGKADVLTLREASPRGAYWKLSPFVRQHTLDCLALGEKFWPWEVIENIQPPVHHGCACYLVSLDEAVGEGLMHPDQVPETGDAVRRAKKALKDAADMEEALGPEKVRHYIETLAVQEAENVIPFAPRHPTLIIEEGAQSTGAMVALYPPKALAKALAIDGGEAVDDLHVTLAYLGKAADLKDAEKIRQAVKGFAATCPPIKGEISGKGLFTGGPDPVTYASVDLPIVSHERQRLVEHLKGAGAPVASDHGFTPHITLAYDDADVDVKARPVTFGSVSLVLGGKREDFALTGTKLEEAQIRWEKGTAKGGEFRPRVGGDPGARLLRKLFPRPRPPAVLRGERHGRWSWINGTYTRVPEADHWERAIAGHVYSSPPGSTNVYKDGRLFDGLGMRSEERFPRHRVARPGSPAVVRKRAVQVREQLRSSAREKIDNAGVHAPVSVGDGASSLLALPDAGFVPVAMSPGTLHLRNDRTKSQLDVGFDGRNVTSADWNPIPPPPPQGRELGRAPYTWEEHRQDAFAWGNDIAQRNNAVIALPDIRTDPGLDDHAGTHQWDGVADLGPDVERDITRAGRKRLAGKTLTEDEKRGVWSAYWATAHEAVGHAVNPIAPQLFSGADANLEEALTEEISHAIAADRLREQGQNDVLAWRDRNPDAIAVRGAYRNNRGALADLLDQAGITEPFDRRVFLEDLKFRTPPSQRMDVLADALVNSGAFQDHGDALDQVELTLEDKDATPRAVLPMDGGQPTPPGPASRFAGSEPVENGNALRLANGLVYRVQKRALAHDSLAPLTDGSAIVAYDRSGQPVAHRHVESEARGRAMLRHLHLASSPGTGLRDIWEPGDTSDSLASKLEGEKEWTTIKGVPVKRRFDGSYGVGHAGHDARRLSGLANAKSAAETALLRAPDDHEPEPPTSPGTGKGKPDKKVTESGEGALHPDEQQALDDAHDKTDEAPKTAEWYLNDPWWKKNLFSDERKQLEKGVVPDSVANYKATQSFKTWDPLIGKKIGGDPDTPSGGPIPAYDATELELGQFAGGSNGARWAKDAKGDPWLVKTYRGNQDRVATETLANAVYRTLGAKVATAGTIGVSASAPDFRSIPDEPIEEPELPKLEKGRRISTGMVLADPDGGLWIYEPKNHYGGYQHTFPKGGLEPGLTAQQNAHKELWEETGLHGKITGWLGDYEGDTGTTRYYLAARTGGDPTAVNDNETEAVKHVTPVEAESMLNRSRDKRVLADAIAHGLPTGKFPDTFPAPKVTPALTYPASEGKVKHNFKPSEKLGEHYMADALLANWDFVGATGDNVLWDGEDNPIRLDQGGTFEYRAMGTPKPYGPVPTEVWTMLNKGQGKRGVMVTDEQMRDQARQIAEKLTPRKIDQLVDAAPFADNEMRERVRENLKARVGWMDAFAKGEVDLPKPLEGDAAHDDLFDSQADLQLYPEQEDALFSYMDRDASRVNDALAQKGKRPDDVQRQIAEIDSLMRHAKTGDDVIAWAPWATDAETAEKLVGKTLASKRYMHFDLDQPTDAPVMVRVTVPAGSSAIYTAMFEDMNDGRPDLFVSRDAKLRIASVTRDPQGRVIVNATLATTKPFKSYTKKGSWQGQAKDVKEARYDEGLHPRGRGGKWIDKLGGNLDRATTLGVTPFLTSGKEAKGRAYRDLVPDRPIHDFATAATLHQDPRWEPLWRGFESDAERLARKNDVDIVRGDRVVGVYQGNYEPSYSVSVTGEKKKIDDFNQALGRKYKQAAVVGFTADPKGRDIEMRFAPAKAKSKADPDAFFSDLKKVMGDEAGATFDADEWRVFVYDGSEDGRATVRKLADLAKKRGMTVRAARGNGDYFQLRQGAG